MKDIKIKTHFLGDQGQPVIIIGWDRHPPHPLLNEQCIRDVQVMYPDGKVRWSPSITYSETYVMFEGDE